MNITDKIRASLISSGVKNLKEYGYSSVTEENIATDKVYRAFFISMLKSNLHKETGSLGKKVDVEIEKLLKELI